MNAEQYKERVDALIDVGEQELNATMIVLRRIGINPENPRNSNILISKHLSGIREKLTTLKLLNNE